MKKAYMVLLSALLLCSCGLKKEDLGMARAKPDETKVTARERLVIPPEYGVRPQAAPQSSEPDEIPDVIEGRPKY